MHADTAYPLAARNINSAQLEYQANLGAQSIQASARYDDYSDFGGHATGNLGYGDSLSPA